MLQDPVIREGLDQRMGSRLDTEHVSVTESDGSFQTRILLKSGWLLIDAVN